MAKIASKSVVDGVVIFTFADSTSLRCDPAELPGTMIQRAMEHGIEQKVGDSYSGAGKQTDPLAYAKGMAEATWASLVAGNWNAGREAGGGISLLFAALCRLYPDKEPGAIQEQLAAIKEADEKGLAKLAKVPKVALAIAEITLERKQALANESDDTALDGFFAEPEPPIAE